MHTLGSPQVLCLSLGNLHLQQNVSATMGTLLTQPHTGPSSCDPREVLIWLEWEGAQCSNLPTTAARESRGGLAQRGRRTGYLAITSSLCTGSIGASRSCACSVCCRVCDYGNQMPSLVRENTREYRSPTGKCGFSGGRSHRLTLRKIMTHS